MGKNFTEPDKSQRHFDGPVTISPKANLVWEKKLWKQGFERVAGLDEAGRGPLAGPVTAAAVTVKCKYINIEIFKNVRDSKKLTEKQREELYEVLTNHPAIEWGVGVVDEKVIDEINILQATKLAMEEAAKNLQADFLLLDGNFLLDMDINQASIVKGDAKVFSIAAASIIAKVTRDRIMRQMHKKYPAYGFDRHKGYGTAAHVSSLEKWGPCAIHRKTFFPVSSMIQ